MSAAGGIEGGTGGAEPPNAGSPRIVGMRDHVAGLDLLRHMMESGNAPPMSRLLDIRVVKAEKGQVKLASLPDERFYNTERIVHGGYAAALLDTACGYVVMSRLDVGSTIATLELKVTYHRPILNSTGELEAHATIVSMGRRIGASEARLVDATGKLYASATSTVLLSHLAA